MIKIPYSFFDKNDLGVIVQFIYSFLLQKKATSFITYNEDLILGIENHVGRPFWHKKALDREYVVSNTLIDYVDWDFDFQEGNGDMVFT